MCTVFTKIDSGIDLVPACSLLTPALGDKSYEERPYLVSNNMPSTKSQCLVSGDMQ